MAVRQQLIWDKQQHKYIGFCDYGNNVNIENKDMECTEALVFMLVCLEVVYYIFFKTHNDCNNTG